MRGKEEEDKRDINTPLDIDTSKSKHAYLQFEDPHIIR